MRYLPTKILCLLSWGLLLAGVSDRILQGADPSVDAFFQETPQQRDARMHWWRDARFGMFIHWGLYAIPAGEWQGNTGHAEWIRHTAKIPITEYDRFVPQFNPVKFDADAWVRMAKRAGMKYIVITSKHHDGFCLWDSKQTDYDVMNTPFRRDILRELTDACKRQGVRMCFYHSIMDWHHPDYLPRRDWEKADRPEGGADYNRYIPYLKNQLRELVSRYQPGVLWFDGEWEDTWTHPMGRDLYGFVRSLQPDIIINNRVDKGRRGMQGLTREGDYCGDFGTPEQEIPDQGLPGMDWESCMTMNAHWGWNKNDTNWKSSEDLIRKLIDIASKGGNFLLNIGPQADGTFPAEAIERLDRIGKWMDVYGESIYGTQASPFDKPSWGRCTQKQLAGNRTRLYLHVFDSPQNRRLILPGLASRPVKAFLLDGGQPLACDRQETFVSIMLPERMPDPIASVVALDIDGAPQIVKVNPYADETPEQRDARMEWWRLARFGMFIHWGVYAVPAGTYKDQRIGGIGEWIMNRGKIPVAEYKQFAREFNPVKYDPDAWVRLAKEAGMKYIVITSKHHDGFALFDSKVTDWDVVDATPYGKDLLKPLAEACRRHGIRLGFYYSQAQDWNHPGGAAAGGHWDPAQDGDMDEYIKTIAVPQVREILSNYGDLAVLWWDTPTNMNKERADMLLPLIRLQPGIITNNRLGGGYSGDLSTPEQHIPATGTPGRHWETCMTMNGTWGYKSYDDNWKSTETLIRNLVDIASKGGNYLLNVGPTALGEIPQPSVERLQEIGRWMRINGESIHATSANPFSKLPWGRCTKRLQAGGALLYLHVFDWPADGELLVPGLKNRVTKAYLLAGNRELQATAGEDGVLLELPTEAPDPIDTVLVLQVEGELEIEKILPGQKSDGTMELPAALADIHDEGGGAVPQVESKYDRPNIGFWTDARDWVAWQFKIDRPGDFEIVAEIAAPADNSRLAIKVAGKTIEAKAAATGDYGRFREQNLGRVTIGQAGKYSLEIRPNRDSWTPINLGQITLKPVDK
ncbi:MAG: alpha-L-fucosidase [Sedimentisphaerales bacterium]|nr:alpha-L-fucosidase [Sedimentisphaerales bacterium]